MVTATGKVIFLGREDVRPSRGYRNIEELDFQDFALETKDIQEALAIIYSEKIVPNVPPKQRILKSRY